MESNSRYRLISCNVFQRELAIALASTPNLIDPEFLELGLHERPDELRAAVQARIDQWSGPEAIAGSGGGRGRAYDAILLGYGLCGNGLAGIEARDIPLVIPRAHDCCTLLLGSRREFLARFGENLSAPWSSAGYAERGTSGFRSSDGGRSAGIGRSYEDLVAEFGEENADYVWETLHPEAHDPILRFIEIPETAGLGHAETMRARARAEGREFLLIPGSMRLLRALVEGGWNAEDFLVIPPGQRLEPTYDHDKVFVAGRDEGGETTNA